MTRRLDWRHTPHSVRQVVRNDECAARIDGHADWSTASHTIAAAKAGDEVHRRAGRATIAERYEDNFVSDRISAIPAPVFADEHAVSRTTRPLPELEKATPSAATCDRGCSRVVSLNELCLDPEAARGVYILAPVAVRPPVECAFAHGGEIVRDQIWTDFIAFVYHCPQLIRTGLDGERGGIA